MVERSEYQRSQTHDKAWRRVAVLPPPALAPEELWRRVAVFPPLKWGTTQSF